MLGIRDDSHCSHGHDGGVSRLSLLQGMLSDMVSEKHPLVFSASAMQLLLIEDGPLPTQWSCEHHAFEKTGHPKRAN